MWLGCGSGCQEALPGKALNSKSGSFAASCPFCCSAYSILGLLAIKNYPNNDLNRCQSLNSRSDPLGVSHNQEKNRTNQHHRDSKTLHRMSDLTLI